MKLVSDRGPAASLRLLLMAAAAAAAALAGAGAVGAAPLGGDPAHGRELFQERCGMCHAAAPGDGDGGQGPPLKGVVGRKAAAAPGFLYSAALQKSGRVWTPASLDRFLAGPQKDVPGTAMPVAVPDAKSRADLIAYLSTVR